MGPYKREFKTINSIKNKNWTDVFKNNAIDTYYKFREENIEVSDLFLSRFLMRVNKKGINKDLVVDLYKNYKPNYKQIDYKNIRFYNGYRLITNKDDTEIISIHKSNNIKSE